jgi:hypothetical protein
MDQNEIMLPGQRSHSQNNNIYYTTPENKGYSQSFNREYSQITTKTQKLTYNMQTNKTVTKKHVNCSTHPQTPVTSFLWLNKPHQIWLKFKQHFPMLNTIITLQQISMCYAIIFKIVLFYCYEMCNYVLPFLIHVNFYISCLLSCNLSYLLHQFLSTCGTKVHFCLHLCRLRES